MTFLDAVRQLLHDPIRLGAVRGATHIPTNHPYPYGFLSVLTTGGLVWKTEHGQRMVPWVPHAEEVLAEDWEVRDMVPGDPVTPPTGTPPLPRRSYTGGIITPTPEGRRPSVGGSPGTPQGGIGGKGTL